VKGKKEHLLLSSVALTGILITTPTDTILSNLFDGRWMDECKKKCSAHYKTQISLFSGKGPENVFTDISEEPSQVSKGGTAGY
jgi:hypothetical protein